MSSFIIALSVILLISVVAGWQFVNVRLRALYSHKVRFKDALWKRRNHIPLLLELASSVNFSLSDKAELISLRQQASQGILPLPELISTEKQITEKLRAIVRLMESTPQIEHIPLFHLVHKELESALDKARIALNDYNFQLTSVSRLKALLWLPFWDFNAKEASREPLPLL